ncbi:MAG: LamG-like jellyroll fold domain-containing protein, partial [Candidatus Paceibacterota bacterium]
WVANSGSANVSKVNTTTGERTDYNAGIGPFGAAFDPVGNAVWVTNYNAANVSKFDVATGSKTNYPTAGGPQGIAFDPVTNSMWVACYNSNKVSKVNINTGARTDYNCPGEAAGPYAVAFDPVTNSVWATNYSNNSISKFNVTSGERVDYPAGVRPCGIAFDPVGNAVWTTNYNAANVSKFDVATGVKNDYIAGAGPHGIAFDPVTNSMWAACYSANSVTRINIAISPKVDYATGVSPQGIAFDPVTNSVWVANYNANTVSKINAATGEKVDYSTGAGPHGVAFDPVTGSVWVTNSNAATVNKFDVATGASVDYATGTSPRDAAFDPVTDSVWVANYGSNNVSKININTGAKTDYAAGTNPYGVAFDPVTNSIWVANRGSNNVSKININTGAKTDYAVGTNPYGVAFDPVTNSVWVANRGSNNVSKINIATGEKVDYAAMIGPVAAAFDSASNSVWVTNALSASVSKFNITTGARTDYATGTNPQGIAFDPVANFAWVTNYDSDTVSKIATFAYLPSGVFTSSLMDTGGNQGYGPLTWDADVPVGAALKLQLAGSEDNFTWGSFLGPDGTVNTYYTTSGQSLSGTVPGFDAKRYIKYKAYFDTTDTSFTPKLNSVNIGYASTIEADRVISDESNADFNIIVPKLAFTQQPSVAVAGAAMSPAFNVAVQRQDNSIFTDDNSTQITLSVAGASTGTLTGTTTVTVSSGVATFPDIIYDKAENVTLAATSVPSYTSATSNPIVVSGGAFHHFDVTGITDPVNSGALSDVTVTIRDAFGNLSTNYTGTIGFSSSDALAELPEEFSFGDNLSASWQEKSDTDFASGILENAQLSGTGEPAGVILGFDAGSMLNFSDSFTTVDHKDAENTTADWDEARGKIRLAGSWQAGSLKGCWLMEDLAGTRADSSAGATSLSSAGAAGSSTEHRQGERSLDLEKDYSQYLYAVPGEALKITGAGQSLSVSCWVKPESVGSRQTVVSLGEAGAGKNGYWMLYINSANRPVFAVSGNGSTWNESTGASVLSADTWYNLSGVYNGTDIRLYVNGALDANGTSNPLEYSGGIYPWQAGDTSRFTVGFRLGSSPAEYFDGLIDELAVFNRALSGLEVYRVYTNGLASAGRYVSSGIVQSPVVASPEDNIMSARFIAAPDVPEGASLTYYLSNSTDGQGAPVWEELATNNENHTFTTSGNSLRWKAVLSAADTSMTPTLSGVSIDYFTSSAGSIYLPSGTYISSPRDLGTSLGTVLNKLNWTMEAPSGTSLKFQLAANNDNLTWNFTGPNGTAATYYTNSGTTIPSILNGKRYIRYKAFLETSDVSRTPAFKDAAISYNCIAGATGIWTFEDGVRLKESGEQWVMAADIGNPDMYGMQSGITVMPASAVKLAITSPALNQSVGASGTVTVATQDNFGNNVASRGYGVIVNLGSDAEAGAYKFYASGTTNEISSITIADGVDSASFDYYQTRSGTPTITVTDYGEVLSSA